MDGTLYQAKALLNTFVRLLPVGFYFGTIFSGIFFQEFKAIIILLGLVIIDLVSLGYRSMFQTEGLVNCAMIRSATGFFTMPSPITLIVSFILSFFTADMYNQNRFDAVSFSGLVGLYFLTVWSRINIGCENVFDSLFNTIIGSLLGALYYNLVKDYYRPPNTESQKEVEKIEDKDFSFDVYVSE